MSFCIDPKPKFHSTFYVYSLDNVSVQFLLVAKKTTLWW